MSVSTNYLALWCAIVVGWNPPAGADAAIAIRGQVLGPSGPLVGAEVALLSIADEHTDGLRAIGAREPAEATSLSKTDAQGRYYLVAPSAGMWRVRAAPEELGPLELDLVPLLDEAELSAVVLPSPRELAVRVVTERGEPVVGARVLVRSGERTRLRRGIPEPTWVSGRRVVTTDVEGRASILRSAGTRERVEVVAPGFGPWAGEVVPGRSVTIRLRAASARTIEVVDAKHRPAADVLVMSEGFELPLGRTDGEGHATVSLSASSARIRLLAPDGGALEAALPALAPDEANVSRLQLDTPTVLAGRVVALPGRGAVPGALVWRNHAPGSTARSDDHGRYRLESSPWITGELQAAAPGYLPERLAWDTPLGESEGPTLVLHAAGALTGVVVDSADRPVDDVEIRTRLDRRALGPLRFNPSYGERQSGDVTRSRSGGRFRLMNLIPGIEYELRLDRQGFAPRRLTARVPPAAEGDGEVRVVLARGLEATGWVLDTRQRPVAGARVTLSEAKPPDILDQIRRLEDPMPRATGATADDGRFSLRDCPPGELDLQVEASGFTSVTVRGIHVESGGDGPVDLGTVVLTPEAVVRGRVQDHEGQPLAGAGVTVVPDNPYLALVQDRIDVAPDAVSASDGTFEVGGLAAGRVLKLRVDLAGYGLKVVSSARAGGDPVTVVLAPTRELRGVVVDPDGSPVSDALVLVAETNFVQLSGGQFTSAAAPARRGRSDDEGRFEVDDLDPGLLDVYVIASGWQRWERRLDPWSGDRPGEIEVVVQPAVQIRGVVFDASGQPAIGAEVRLWEPDVQPGEIRYRAPLATTDGDGAYRIDELPSGTARFEARHSALGRAVRDVELLPGENLLDFQLQAAGRVSGWVVDRNGSPVPGAQVIVGSALSSWAPPRLSSDQMGFFEIEGLAAGAYSIEAVKTGVARSTEPVLFELREDSISDLRIEVSATGAVVGRVLGLDFEELTQVRLHAGGLTDVGSVDYEGRYRIPDLAPGTWTIVAEIPRTGRQAAGRVRIDANEAETHLDLDFESGLVLRGQVEEGSEPGRGLTVTAFGPGGIAPWAETEPSGRFRLSGLPPGDYLVEVAAPGREARYRRALTLSSDLDLSIELTTSAKPRP